MTYTLVFQWNIHDPVYKGLWIFLLHNKQVCNKFVAQQTLCKLLMFFFPLVVEFVKLSAFTHLGMFPPYFEVFVWQTVWLMVTCPHTIRFPPYFEVFVWQAVWLMLLVKRQFVYINFSGGTGLVCCFPCWSPFSWFSNCFEFHCVSFSQFW